MSRCMICSICMCLSPKHICLSRSAASPSGTFVLLMHFLARLPSESSYTTR